MRVFRKEYITLIEAKSVSALPPKVDLSPNDLRADFVKVYIQDVKDNGTHFFDIQTYYLLK